MAKRFDFIYKTGELVWSLAKGFIVWVLMAALCSLMFFFMFVIKAYYDEISNFYKKFNTYEHAVVQLLPMIPSEQKSILKFRKQESWRIYNYVVVYQLNSSQIQKFEVFFDKIKNKSQPKPDSIPCISKTSDTKWLFPRISRHYIGDLSSEYREVGSFLVYGSDDDIYQVEKACQNGNFKIVNLKTNKFEQVQIALNKSSQILIFNVVEQRSRH